MGRQTVDVTVKDHKQTQGRGERDGESIGDSHTASGDRSACVLGFSPAVTCVTGTPTATWVNNMKIHTRQAHRCAAIKDRAKQGVGEEGSKRTQKALLCHATSPVTWNDRDGEGTAPVSEGYGEEPSGDLQEAPPTSVIRGPRQGCFLPVASLYVPTVCGCLLPVASVSPLCAVVF